MTRRRGSAAIEFALWLPVLFVLMSAVVDWGSYITTRAAVARAAMDAARVGAGQFESAMELPGTAAIPRAKARATAALKGMGLPCAGAPGCVVEAAFCARGVAGSPCDCDAPGCAPPVDALYVKVDYAYAPWFDWALTPARIEADFVMAMENQR